MVDTRTRPDRHLVITLNAVRRGDLDLAGGKGANLGELVAGGFPVPEGFLVTTDAYAQVVAAADLARVIADELSAGHEDGAVIRAAFARAAVPATLSAAIRTAYEDLGGGTVAVRSSATAEDLAGAAFAGQQDTYLNVVGAADVLDAVRRCWASLWTERAIAYRRRQGVSGDLSIAVVVQRMVAAEFAGVLFTANPVTGDRDEIVIDANRGLGEAVVSGLVTPDHYVLDGRGAIREHTPGRHEMVIRVAEGGGLERVTEDDVDRPDLPEDRLTELAALGRAVAAHFGRPQDIEWAYADGRIWLVQARPMTALPPPPLELNRIQRKLGLQLLDYMTERPYPLDMSGWVRPGIGRMVERMLGEIVGLHVDLSDCLPERGGVVQRFVPPAPRPTSAMPRRLARLPGRIRRFPPAGWTDDPRFAQFEQGMRELEGLDPERLDWAGLFSHCRRSLAVMDVISDLRVDYLPGSGVGLLRLRVLLGLLRSADLFGPLVAGARTRTGDANRALEALATRARTDPPVLEAFETLDSATLAARLELGDDRFTSFRRVLGEFLDEYGHRETISPLMITAPTWSDDPAVVLGLLNGLVADPQAATTDTPSARAERRLFGHRRLRSAWWQRRARRVLESARQGVALREDTHFHGTRVMPILRRTLLEAGRRLAAAGVLARAEQVFHLRLEELEALAEPHHVSADDADRTRSVVRERAERRAELAGVPMIAAANLRILDRIDRDALVTGTGASGGVATGPVRVIRDPSAFETMRPGEVLVCPYTNPAWTPLFQRAAAVVVDSGGVGSHAAIVAREYGIPAVLGTATSTAVLRDGQRVRVDGDRGRVTAEER